MEWLAPIIIAVLSSTAISSLVIFFITRKDKRQDDHNEILEKLTRLEHDMSRTQLLLLMNDMPDNTTEILIVAEYYFVNLKGDWYMSILFDEWLEKKGLNIPVWYKK